MKNPKNIRFLHEVPIVPRSPGCLRHPGLKGGVHVGALALASHMQAQALRVLASGFRA